jgi:hypothetical protein
VGRFSRKFGILDEPTFADKGYHVVSMIFMALQSIIVPWPRFHFHNLMHGRVQY